MTAATENLAELYLADETAWLEAMARLIAEGAVSELDFENLREYLTDMARRDRHEVESRLVQLLMHILKWTHQPDHRSRSWRSSIINQQFELGRAMGRGVLRAHAEAVLPDLYREAVVLAAAETGLPEAAFPSECALALDELLEFEAAE
ncbi:MAG: DUF29 domain-containing protein [Gemmataceae bacterium]